MSPRSPLRLRGAFEFGDIELLHPHDSLHRFRVFDEVRQACGHDLPGEAELVLEPAALNLAAASRELRPIMASRTRRSWPFAI